MANGSRSMTDRIARWWPSAPAPTLTSIVGIAMFVLAPLLGWSLAYGLAYDRPMKWLAFGALIMVAIMPAIVRWPVITTFGLYAIAATSLDAFPLLPGGATLTKPIGILAGAVLLGAGLIERRLGRPPGAALWWGVFMLWALLSAMWAMDPERVLQRMPTAVSLAALYLVAMCFRPSRRELYWVCALTVLGGVVASALAYWFGLNELATGGAARGRLMLNEMDSNPNMLGRVLLLPLALAIAGFVGGRGLIWRGLTVGCVAFIALGVLISMSRGAVVATAAIMLILLYRLRARWQFIAIIVLLLVAATFAPDTFYQRIDDVVSGKDDTGSGRLDIWRTAFEVWEQAGVLGVGLDNFPLLYKAAVPGSGTSTHNTYLTALLDLGVPGLAMMLAAVASGLLAVRRARSRGHDSIVLSALEAACIGLLVLCMFGDLLWRKVFWLAWILLTWAMYADQGRNDTLDAPGLRG
jgi:O-antigen ligase